MAKGKKTGGKDIQPGQVLNPSGRPKIPDDLKELRVMDKEKLERILHRVFWLDAHGLTKIIKDPSTPAIELAICTILVATIKKADYKRLSFLLDRTIGRVPIKAEIVSPNRLADYVAEIPAEMREEEIERLIRERQMIKDEEQG